MPKPTSDCRATERKHPWPMVRLGDVCEDKILRIKSIGEPNIAYIDIASIDNVQKRVVGVKEYDVEDAPGRAQQVVVPGDVLVSNVRPNLNAVAIVDVASAIPLIASTGFCVLRVKDTVLPEYVYYYVQISDFIDPLVAVSEKASYPSVTDTIVKNSLIPLPPLSVQREIVVRLERELAAVEKMKKGFEELAETAKAEFKAELKEVFEEISRGGAETRRLGDVCELIPGFAFKSIEFGDFSTKVIRIGNINPPSIDFSDGIGVNTQAYPQEKLSKYVAYEGDCLVAMTGATIGKMGVMGVGRAYVNQRVLIVRAKSWLDQKYLSALLMSASFRKFTEINADSKAAQPNISAGTIGSYEIPLPTLSAQREVVARLDGAKAKAEKLEAKAREGVAICEIMRKAILKEAFEGSIREVESYD